MTQFDKELYQKNEVQMEFFINAQTYCSTDASPEDATAELVDLGKTLASYIVGAIDGIEHGEPKKEDARTVIIPISFKNAIITDDSENIGLVVNVIDRMYEAMLVSARRK